MSDRPPSLSPTHWQGQVARLKYKVNVLEQRLSALEEKAPDSDIVSRGFWTRAFAVFGHNLAAQIAIGFILFVIGVCAGVLQ